MPGLISIDWFDWAESQILIIWNMSGLYIYICEDISEDLYYQDKQDKDINAET